MLDKTPSSLIINSPYEKPARYWDQDENGKLLTVTQGRRPAAYELYDTRTNTRRVEKLELVNAIRERVDAWRDAGWPGVTSVTRQLLEHWFDRGEWDGEGKCWIGGQYPFYFCQLEAIETLIWMLEAAPEYRQGIYVPGDGGAFERLCNKMATGSGKTTVMAMIITWQVLNALTYPKSPRKYSHAIFLVAPGLTVKSRLQVLMPGHSRTITTALSCARQKRCGKSSTARGAD
jgi:type III restriction enzyme